MNGSEATIVKVSVPLGDQKAAIRILEKFGISLSDLIRLTIRRIAEEGRLPFDFQPKRKPVFLEDLTPDQIDQLIEEGLADEKKGKNTTI